MRDLEGNEEMFRDCQIADKQRVFVHRDVAYWQVIVRCDYNIVGVVWKHGGVEASAGCLNSK